MKVLITGINGFIGAYLCRLLKLNHLNVYGLDTALSTSQNVDGYYSIDITKKFYLDMEFDILIHLAALNRTNVDADFRYELFEQVNVSGTKHVIESCQFEQFIYISTASIYCRSGGVITENSPIQPVGHYAISKYQAELLCQRMIPKHRLLILRPVNIVGYGQKQIAAIPIFFKKAIDHAEIFLYVSPQRVMQLLDVADFVEYLILFINSKTYGIFNLSNDDHITMMELVDQIKQICHSKSEVVFSKNADEHLAILSSQSADLLLNWKAEITIKRILEKYYYYFISEQRQEGK